MNRQVFIIIRIGHQYHDHIGVLCGSNFFLVEGNQFIANTHFLSFCHKTLETITFHSYGIHTHMDQ